MSLYLIDYLGNGSDFRRFVMEEDVEAAISVVIADFMEKHPGEKLKILWTAKVSLTLGDDGYAEVEEEVLNTLADLGEKLCP